MARRAGLGDLSAGDSSVSPDFQVGRRGAFARAVGKKTRDQQIGNLRHGDAAKMGPSAHDCDVWHLRPSRAKA
jgi:hypothetical protein